MEDPGLQAIFDHVVGRDVVRKLMQVSQEGRVSLTFLLYLETLNRSHHISKYINRVTYTTYHNHIRCYWCGSLSFFSVKT